MSQKMIRSGSSSRAVTDRGLGLISLAVIDQHFLARRRLPRLLDLLSDESEMIGLGIDERTALVVQGKRARVIGASRVVVCRGATHDRDAWVHYLEPGDDCDLRTILPP